MSTRHAGERANRRAQIKDEGQNLLTALEADLIQTYAFKLAQLGVTLPAHLIAAARAQLTDERSAALASLRQRIRGNQNARMEAELGAMARRQQAEKAALRESQRQEKQWTMASAPAIGFGKSGLIAKDFRRSAINVTMRKSGKGPRRRAIGRQRRHRGNMRNATR